MAGAGNAAFGDLLDNAYLTLDSPVNAGCAATLHDDIFITRRVVNVPYGDLSSVSHHTSSTEHHTIFKAGDMTLLKLIYLTVAFPLGFLFTIAYGFEDIRYAVCDYVPAAFFPPFGLVMFFAYGACVGLMTALLVVPEAILNQHGNREDLRQVLSVSGAVRVRVFCAASLSLFLFGISIIYENAYG